MCLGLGESVQQVRGGWGLSSAEIWEILRKAVESRLHCGEKKVGWEFPS